MQCFCHWSACPVWFKVLHVPETETQPQPVPAPFRSTWLTCLVLLNLRPELNPKPHLHTHYSQLTAYNTITPWDNRSSPLLINFLFSHTGSNNLARELRTPLPADLVNGPNSFNQNRSWYNAMLLKSRSCGGRLEVFMCCHNKLIMFPVI